MRAAWWWIDRWRKSTAYTDMTLAEQGAYRNLLDELWLRDGLLPADERVLGRASGDPVEWPSHRDKILSHFILTAQGWRNETHDKIQAESRYRADKQKRYRHRHGNVSGNVTQSPSPSLRKKRIAVGNVTDTPTPWSKEACDDWIARYQGTPPGGRIGKALKPLIAEHGWPEVRAAWQSYLQQTEAEYASAQRFAATYGRWSGNGNPAEPGIIVNGVRFK